MTQVLLLGAGTGAAARVTKSLEQIDRSLCFVVSPEVRFETNFGINADAILLVIGRTSSIDLISTIKSASDAGVPVLMLLPNLDLFDVGLVSGFVDFCLPPHSPEEIAMRLQSVIRRSSRNGSPNLINIGELSIDVEKYEVRISGRKVDLTYKEYELLKVLAANPGRVFTREALLRTVWDYDYFGGARTVDVHVRRLRAKIADGNQRLIETIHKVGYRLSVADALSD